MARVPARKDNKKNAHVRTFSVSQQNKNCRAAFGGGKKIESLDIVCAEFSRCFKVTAEKKKYR